MLSTMVIGGQGGEGRKGEAQGREGGATVVSKKETLIKVYIASGSLFCISPPHLLFLTQSFVVPVKRAENPSII